MYVGLDVLLMTASATYNRQLSRGNWQTTVAWGRSKRETLPLPILSIAEIDSLQSLELPAGAHVHFVSSGNSGQSPIQRGILVESAATLGHYTFFARFESAGKTSYFLRPMPVTVPCIPFVGLAARHIVQLRFPTFHEE